MVGSRVPDGYIAMYLCGDVMALAWRRAIINYHELAKTVVLPARRSGKPLLVRT